MSDRRTKAARTQRRVIVASFLVAVALHVAVFVLSPTFRAIPLVGEDEVASLGTQGVPLTVHVHFGPPDISVGDTGTVTEPPDRTLETRHRLAVSETCAEEAKLMPLPLSARVNLRVQGDGEAEGSELMTGSGSACGDEVLTAVADALLYQWLPSEQHPAPVALVQPITLLKIE